MCIRRTSLRPSCSRVGFDPIVSVLLSIVGTASAPRDLWRCTSAIALTLAQMDASDKRPSVRRAHRRHTAQDDPQLQRRVLPRVGPQRRRLLLLADFTANDLFCFGASSSALSLHINVDAERAVFLSVHYVSLSIDAERAVSLCIGSDNHSAVLCNVPSFSDFGTESLVITDGQLTSSNALSIELFHKYSDDNYNSSPAVQPWSRAPSERLSCRLPTSRSACGFNACHGIIEADPTIQAARQITLSSRWTPAQVDPRLTIQVKSATQFVKNISRVQHIAVDQAPSKTNT